MSNALTDTQQTIAKLAQENSKRAKLAKRTELARKFEDGQLVFWPESERGIPNEVARCALFTPRNRREPRAVYPAKSPAVISIYGGGELRYYGEELRQDDATVWLQLIHLAKEAKTEWISFTRHNFLKAIDWPISGASYSRLDTAIRRLHNGSLEGYSKRLDLAKPIRMIAGYEMPEKDMAAPVRVRVYDSENDLLFLFDQLYSRLEWEVRLQLPDGLARWLHTFYCTHMEAYALRLETLAEAAEISLEVEGDDAKTKQRLRDVKKQFNAALESLQAAGFLSAYTITKEHLVYVSRPGQEIPKIDF